MRRALAIGNAVAVVLALATVALGAYAVTEDRRAYGPVTLPKKHKRKP